MTNDYNTGRKGRTFLIKHLKGSNNFTIEDIDGDTVIIFTNEINDLISELQRLKELTDNPKGKPGI